MRLPSLWDNFVESKVVHEVNKPRRDEPAMDDSCGSGPRVPTKVSIMVMEIGEDETVEIREVVVDPLLPRFDVGGEVARQPLQRVDEARRADLGVQRGVAHRSARR
eukprot:scaffold11189_cov110-Isochrysis_galbana.AAC.1